MRDFLVIAVAVCAVIFAWFMLGGFPCWGKKKSPREQASRMWSEWREELVALGQIDKAARVESDDGNTRLSFSPSLGGGELVISRKGGEWQQAWAAPDEWMADAAPLYPALYAAVVDEVIATRKKHAAPTSPALDAARRADSNIELAELRLVAKMRKR